MIYQGKAFQLFMLEDNMAECRFDLQGESVNKFNQLAIHELSDVIEAVSNDSSIKGLMLTSAKKAFIVGADITEFTTTFAQEESILLDSIMQVNHILSSLEDLPIPTVAAINGLALGGGFEYCLSADYRIIAEGAKVGLPEVKLGIYPGWGGTVRLSRLIGADNAIEWICTGKEQKSETALKTGAADAVVTQEHLHDAACHLLKQCMVGSLDFMARKKQKKDKLQLANIEAMMVFETAKPFVASKAGPHYPAPVSAVKTIQRHAFQPRDKALETEAKGFVKLAKTTVCQNLIGLFLNDQFLKKEAKKTESLAIPIKQSAVLGAGIMGGGIAYQSASKNIPILMKDIQQEGLNLGLSEAKKLLAKLIKIKRIDADRMGDVLNKIQPTLSYGDFNAVDIVVEAVVENTKVKQAVLTDTEQHVKDNAVLASNTSTISINELAKPLKRPENFCGMHFFNPVHKMPLVEVIRGKATSDKTVATVVQYAKSIGKTPIVVNDCPGFLVNRVLFPYFAGFAALLHDGADFQQVDKVMERFGWPMGPAYLLDVVGLDTASHAGQVMANGYPDRMSKPFVTAPDILFENERFGQKNQQGFYRYESDKKGKLVKKPDEAVYDLIRDVCQPQKAFDDEEIIARMMIPLCIETIRALEEGIVASPQEADMGLIFGIGFPPFLGGALKYIDTMGIPAFVKQADAYQDLGKLYHPTDALRAMAKNDQTFYH
ncbi:Fatty acid oxidation complex subunit alpha [invertebrate metagenome]|uniref:enoyl-CoA hydratase n=1 Tax=invertebrate metagenome TaxID=1711999 RepID=A0A2H9T5T0_9ZZZZ